MRIAALGIVLRGARFALRQAARSTTRNSSPRSERTSDPSVVGGVLTATAAADLSAVYLAWDARRLSQTG